MPYFSIVRSKRRCSKCKLPKPMKNGQLPQGFRGPFICADCVKLTGE